MLSTSEFAAAIGISESSVRRMADSGELQIQRTRGGHRRIPASEAVRYVREHKTTVLRPDLLGFVAGIDQLGKDDYGGQLLSAFQSGHAKTVIGLLQAMYASGMSIASICDGPIHEALRAIGNSWPHDKRAIFVEHRATLLCVRAICQLRMSSLDPDEDAPTAMGAAPTDDPYLLPSLMVSLVLHDGGFDETNLGPNTPVDVLCDSVEDEKPNLVWLAITNPIRSRNYHREIEHLENVVDSYGGLFLVGGQGAGSYEGAHAVRCQTMVELEERASRLLVRPSEDS